MATLSSLGTTVISPGASAVLTHAKAAYVLDSDEAGVQLWEQIIMQILERYLHLLLLLRNDHFITQRTRQFIPFLVLYSSE